jgi:Tfp pilus assembly protein PilN
MNAVNLIPADSRKRRSAPTTSRVTLALFGGLVLILVAAVLYVNAANNVTSKRDQLTRATAAVASWSAAASSYAPYMETAQQRSQALADVRQLAASRYPWEQFLSQVSDLMPAKAALSSLTATTSPSGSGTTTGTTPATPSAGSTTSSAAASGPPVPSVQLDGCASTQSVVAQTMVALHRIQGVTAVTLASASSSSAQSGGASSGVGGGGCPFPVSFQVSLTFAPTAAASGTGTTSTGSSSPTAAAASAATPTASAATSSTGGQAQ